MRTKKENVEAGDEPLASTQKMKAAQRVEPPSKTILYGTLISAKEKKAKIVEKPLFQTWRSSDSSNVAPPTVRPLEVSSARTPRRVDCLNVSNGSLAFKTSNGVKRGTLETVERPLKRCDGYLWIKSQE